MKKPEIITLQPIFGKKRVHPLHFDSEGHYTLHLKVHAGEISILHNSYSLDSGAWLDRSGSNDKSANTRIIHADQEGVFHFRIAQKHGQLDKIFLTNNRLFQKAHFSIEKINQLSTE